MSQTMRDRIAQQLRAYNATVKEMAKQNVYEEAQLRYEVVITPIDLKTWEPTFDNMTLHLYFNTPMFKAATILQKVAPEPSVEKYFYQREGVTFRVDLFIRLFAPTVAAEHTTNHQFSSAKLDAWDATSIVVHNPEGRDPEERDWHVTLDFKKPEGKKMAILTAVTVEHNPKHCNSLLEILEAEAVALEEMHLLRVMKSASIVPPPFHLEPLFTENGHTEADHDAPSVKRRPMLASFQPSPGFKFK